MLRRLLPAALISPLAVPALAQNRAADFRWEKALAAGNEVSIHNVSGDVTVIPSTSGKVEVVGIKRGSGDFERIRADVQVTSRGVVICVLDTTRIRIATNAACIRTRDNDRDNRGNREWNNVSMNLEVAVPANVQVSANSVSGDVSITGATGDVRANSVSGDLKLDRLRASSVSANTVSGNVEVSIRGIHRPRRSLVQHGERRRHSRLSRAARRRPLDVHASAAASTATSRSRWATVAMSRGNIEARIGTGGRRLDVSHGQRRCAPARYQLISSPPSALVMKRFHSAAFFSPRSLCCRRRGGSRRDNLQLVWPIAAGSLDSHSEPERPDFRRPGERRQRRGDGDEALAARRSVRRALRDEEVRPNDENVVICALWGENSSCDEQSYQSHTDSRKDRADATTTT